MNDSLLHTTNILEKTDSELIRETQEGTLSSFEILVKRYERRLLSFSYKKVLDYDAAADVAQETFIRVFKNLSTFDQQKQFAPWMYTIAKNLSLDIIRKGRHTAILDWEVEDSKESLISRIIKAEQVTLLWNAIKSLPSKYKEPLVGYYFSDLSIAQLAYNFNMSENTIKTHLRRAKAHLKQELGRKGFG